MIINGNGENTMARWSEIWQAVTAVNAKCVRVAGKGGKATNLGTTKKLSVTVTEHVDAAALALPGSTAGSGTQAIA